jgi:pyruvate/2-oxoglutarate dehydrogenase complex dihydrolipoamide acyltransferase (E2) component
VALLTLLDRWGMLPRALHRVSPFHTSVFITDLGSLGIAPIYHHLYEFGTTSVFLAFGAKERERVLDDEGKVVVRKTVGLKVVSDERIADGYDYVAAFKFFTRLFRHPEVLETPPASVVEDVD